MNKISFDKLISLYIKKYNFLCKYDKNSILLIKIGCFYEAFGFDNIGPDLNLLANKFNTYVIELKFLSKFFNSIPKMVSISRDDLLNYSHLDDHVYIYELNNKNDLSHIPIQKIKDI